LKQATPRSATLHLGDCLDVLRTMPENSIDAVVTDPPYGLAFMGKKWDYDVPGVDVWAECLRVLKPGGHLVAFAGTRTQHRMAVRIEDAGFDIRDMLAWVYGSGFPKSMDVSKAIAKAQEQQSESARQWQGWGTALKPALEPITLARKPFPGTVAANVLAHGTGAINVDECRIEHAETLRTGAGATWSAIHRHEGRKAETRGSRNHEHSGGGTHFSMKSGSSGGDALGRWPANLIHDGSDEVLASFPDGPGQQFAGGPQHGQKNCVNAYNDYGPRETLAPRSGGGSAARFFYCAKASKEDRDAGLAGHELRLLALKDELTRGSTHAGDLGFNAAKKRSNHHPTVKPTALMRWLVRLITPPGGIVLDPFMGSGSTGKAALLEHARFIGIEREPEYFEIAQARIDYIRKSGVQVGLFESVA
jgi:DNA modification methylase